MSGALATTLGTLAGCDRPRPWNDPAVAAARQTLGDPNREQMNNAFLPRVGYYHAPFFGWYPQPFNFHDPIQGYYYGGSWHPTAYLNAPLSSRPSAVAVAMALAQLPATNYGNGYAQGYGGGGGGYYGGASSFFGNSNSGGTSSSGTSVGRSSGGGSVARAGFGSSAHASAGA